MPEYSRLVYFPNESGEFFNRGATHSTTPGHNGWTIATTGTTPTATNAADGCTIACNAANEAQIICLYQKDVLPFDVDEIQSMEFYAKVASIDSVTTLVMGLGSARNDTADSVTYNAWFRMQGSASTSNLLCESDDNTTDYDDKATGTTLSSTLKKFVIDFSAGKTDIRFFVDNARVASSTTFTLSGLTTGLQPIFQLQKASGTGTPSATITGVKIAHAKLLS